MCKFIKKNLTHKLNYIKKNKKGLRKLHSPSDYKIN